MLIAKLVLQEVEMINNSPRSLFSILRESPFFAELSIKERESIVKELLWTYPELVEQTQGEDELGYEASWLMSQKF